MISLHRETVSDALWDALRILMKLKVLEPFRLVGGTSLSLQMGHRMSVDIDLFTDASYGSIDFNEIDDILDATFPVVEKGYGGHNSIGKSYYIGKIQEELVKLDFFYTDTFVFPIIQTEEVRLAEKSEIAAMKLDVISRGGRKKDFWDLHELLDHFSLIEMVHFHEKRYPYCSSREELISMLTNYAHANEDFDPICLRNKYWELIKIDLQDRVKEEF